MNGFKVVGLRGHSAGARARASADGRVPGPGHRTLSGHLGSAPGGYWRPVPAGYRRRL